MKIDIRNNEIIWFDNRIKMHRHRPLSTTFKEIEVLVDGRILIIEDYTKFNYESKSNLYCLNRELQIDWHLEYPIEKYKSNSGYTAFTVNGEILYANTLNCVRVKFDMNGNILDRIFTK